jgi:hypothetical protein
LGHIPTCRINKCRLVQHALINSRISENIRHYSRQYWSTVFSVASVL